MKVLILVLGAFLTSVNLFFRVPPCVVIHVALQGLLRTNNIMFL